MTRSNLQTVFIAAALLQLNLCSAFILKPTNNIVARQRNQVATEFPVGQKRSALFQSAVPLEGKNYDTEEYRRNDTPLSPTWVSRGGAAVANPGASLKQLYAAYLGAIEHRPLLTKGLTAAVVNFLGDIMAQYLEASAAGAAFLPNWVRLQGFFLCGLLYTGPYVHTWYEQLWKVGSWMDTKFDSPKQQQTMVQLILDQTIGVAIFFSTYFYVYEIIDALVCHRLPVMSAATAKITDNLGSVLITNYYFWPITNWVSFTFVPVQLRVLLNNVVGVFWNAFLCTKMAG